MDDTKRIAVLPGDGIGKEVTAEAVRILKAVSRMFGRLFSFEEHDFGGISIEKHGQAITSEVLEACGRSDAVLVGAVGGEKWASLPLEERPEYALLVLRKELECFANLRPIRLFPALIEITPLQPQIVSRGVDFIIVRELLNGLYYGERGVRKSQSGEIEAFDTAVYPESAVRQVAHFAFQLAGSRRKKVTSLDKSNVLATSRLWRETVTGVADEYPDCSLEHQIIDRASMQILLSPSEYDVILVNNEYGDIISEEATVLGASLGMIPSASIGADPPYIFEPIHGSAPDIAGEGIANPIGAVLSAALLVQYSFGFDREAKAIERAVESALEQRYRTGDLARDGEPVLSTSELGDKIIEELVDN